MNSYSEQDRAAHYGGTIARERCIVCLLGMAASHGRTDVQFSAAGTAEDASTAEDAAFDKALTYARTLGTEHGANAAEWWLQDTIGGRVDGLDALQNARRIVRGLDAGDPAVLDTLPQADLSGEWADTLTGPQLVSDAWAEAGMEQPEDMEKAGFTELCDAYEQAFSDAAQGAIERACKAEIAAAKAEIAAATAEAEKGTN